MLNLGADDVLGFFLLLLPPGHLEVYEVGEHPRSLIHLLAVYLVHHYDRGSYLHPREQHREQPRLVEFLQVLGGGPLPDAV